ncbi:MULTISPECIES: hypothetical protein [Metabacillus]|uniref:Uncharacterized protein n=1 Tax=Metabacillus hrfriensis TaxID=3048891 RepID=A0ACD4RHX6_9BACI|nr:MULTISPECIES: hypothetical protein [Metabacillus]UAL54537.1 hypothetical protein K8L98_12580 [Metabacillus dongyingensis]UOK56237.1 hypothetical protein MGI18_14595 [Bacillus sp. OVS6]USK30870.1 hypothetical protein LIT32_12565 [Bacillus sp. CMF21]WHZ60118.1 hypothetical protein QLQ22_12645 [Metabacillus sp. CT-WN-B3]
MKARYELNNMNLTLSNVTLRDSVDSYVLLKAADENNNEVTIKLSHHQAEFLEAEFKDLNRRRKNSCSGSSLHEKDKTEDEAYDLFNNEFFNEEK